MQWLYNFCGGISTCILIKLLKKNWVFPHPIDWRKITLLRYFIINVMIVLFNKLSRLHIFLFILFHVAFKNKLCYLLYTYSLSQVTVSSFFYDFKRKYKPFKEVQRKTIKGIQFKISLTNYLFLTRTRQYEQN